MINSIGFIGKMAKERVKMLDPRTILVAIPCYDGKLMAETAGVLLSCQGLFAALHTPSECSHISLVRNLIAGQFLASQFEWLVCIDSDIAFTRRDLELLLEPCDLNQDYVEPTAQVTEADAGRPPRPTRGVIAQSTDLRTPDVKSAAAADMLVCAEYSYKNDQGEPVRLGMGFVRIHRSVFQVLEELKHEAGSTVEVRRDLFERLKTDVLDEDLYTESISRDDLQELFRTATDRCGESRLWQCSHQGRRYTDFYPSGPILSQFVPTAQWQGEDHGFFTLCMLAGIIPRIETRTRLIHIGRKGYPYLGPDQGGGQ